MSCVPVVVVVGSQLYYPLNNPDTHKNTINLKDEISKDKIFSAERETHQAHLQLELQSHSESGTGVTGRSMHIIVVVAPFPLFHRRRWPMSSTWRSKASPTANKKWILAEQ